MFLFTYTAAVLALFFVVAAAFIYIKGNRDCVSLSFIFYILSSAVWIGGNAFADIAQSNFPLIVASTIAFAGGTCMVTSFLIFVDTFVDQKPPSTTKLILYFLPTVLLNILSFSDKAVLSTSFPIGQPAQIVPGIQYHLSILFLFSGLLYGLTRLYLLFSNVSGRRKLQTFYISIGFVGLFFGGGFFSVLLPLLGELRFFNVGPLFSLILVLGSGYAILKHNLLDIRIVVQRGFIYSVLFFCIASFYLTIITLTSLFLQSLTPEVILVNAGLTTIIGIFTVPHIDRFLRKKTDRIFFKDTYDYADALYELSEKIHKSVLLEDIQILTEETLQKILKTKEVQVQFVSEYVAESLHDTQIDKLRTLNVPIEYDGNIVGLIHLGEKKSGDVYTHEDTVLIRTFAHQVAAAFEKAKLYSEVQAYSRELEKRVAERTEEVRRMQDLQTQMMLDISHKLQNPLTIVKSQLALLRKKAPKEDAFIFFEHTIDEISVFIYDLLHLAQLESIPLEQNGHTKHNLSEHMEELTEYFEVLAQHNGVTLQKSIPQNIFHTYSKSQMTELATNLLSNALKYRDIKKQQQHIMVSLFETETEITLVFIDNGLGIPENDLPYIFDRFYRTRLTRSIKGTGLGLAICKRIVTLHSGKIDVTSNTEHGTVFTVVLPKKKETESTHV